ncbi:MAG: glycosyltransferase [Candidatus Paracaedibacteraceae bacterium]|nr:glycosyltransferase [Candidatus Paracaedibacteraceae bacterium]
MSRRLFVHATNVHQGGGHSLLSSILNSLPKGMQTVCTLDERMRLPEGMAQDVQIKRVAPKLAQRFLAERWLADNVAAEDVVLCFGNLPPLFKLRGHTVVFVQNRYLIDDVKLSGFPLKTRLRLAVERLWLSAKMGNADEFVVQTPSMKNLLELRTKGRIPVGILPFMANHEKYVRSIQMPELQDGCEFIYVASGEPHKNHRQLMEAWCLLAKEGINPMLTLTLDKERFPDLCGWIEQMVERCRLNIVNLGNLPHEQVKKLYAQAGALVYPSVFESFGLPLIEARQAGLPILASELDYVRDVVDPEQTFDPESAVSIARAVKRFLRIEERALPLQDASGFVRCILERAK